MAWMVRHAAVVRTMHVVGVDGKTAWQRVRGAACNIHLVHFGEVARYKCRSQEGRIGHSDDRWATGVWLGIEARTGQHIMFDPEHGGVRHARTIMRLPDAHKFELDRIIAINATPWAIHEPSTPGGVFVEKTVVAPENADTTVKVRKLYILPRDLEMYGYTPGCKKCQSYLGHGSGQASTSHSEACRQRIMLELQVPPPK